jgi:hypothetical protein
MATKPYRISDRRSASGYISPNTLIQAATQTTDRKEVPMLDADVHRTINSFGRRVLMTLGRHIFWNFPAMHGAIKEQADLSVSSYIPQYTGRNKTWGDLAEEWLFNWHQIMDLAGPPFDYDSFVRGKVIDPLVDGENYTLLTETTDAYPMIQVIPAHRVGGYYSKPTAEVRFSGTQMIIDGVVVETNRPYPADGEISFTAQIIDGVIVDQYGRALAYRLNDDSTNGQEYRDVSARSLFPTFCPNVVGQVRGFSGLASSVFSMQDIKEWNEFEMLAQKAFSTQTLIETNETGEVDTAKAILSGAAEFDENNKKTAMDMQKLDGGAIRYFRAGTGSKIQAFDYDRPGAQSQRFVTERLRDAFKGTQWDFLFSLDPQAVGGAPMRAIIFKINARIREMQKPVGKACKRVDGFAIAKAMQRGELPWDDDWYMWEYQGPGEVTADKKYDSDVALQEVSQGYSTRKIECARRGLYIEEVDAQREAEADSDLERAGRLAKKHGITIQEALVVLRPPTVNQQMLQPQQAAKTETNPEP